MTDRLIGAPAYGVWNRKVTIAWRRFDRLSLQKENRPDRPVIEAAWNDYIAALSELYPECASGAIPLGEDWRRWPGFGGD